MKVVVCVKILGWSIPLPSLGRLNADGGRLGVDKQSILSPRVHADARVAPRVKGRASLVGM